MYEEMSRYCKAILYLCLRKTGFSLLKTKASLVVFGSLSRLRIRCKYLVLAVSRRVCLRSHSALRMLLASGRFHCKTIFMNWKYILLREKVGTEEADLCVSVGAVGLESGICSAGRAVRGREHLSVGLMLSVLLCKSQTPAQWVERAGVVPIAQSCRWKEAYLK